MPDILGYIHAIAAVFEAQNNTFSNGTVIVIGSHTNFTAQYHKSLILVRMMMNGHFGSWFQRIEHTVAQVIKRLMKVQVHPQAWRCLCLCCYFVKKFLVNYLHLENTNTYKTTFTN